MARNGFYNESGSVKMVYLPIDPGDAALSASQVKSLQTQDIALQCTYVQHTCATSKIVLDYISE
jgi:hypothetical protein